MPRPLAGGCCACPRSTRLMPTMAKAATSNVRRSVERFMKSPLDVGAVQDRARHYLDLANQPPPSLRRPVRLHPRVILVVWQVRENRPPKFREVQFAELLKQHVAVWRNQDAERDGGGHGRIEGLL